MRERERDSWLCNRLRLRALYVKLIGSLPIHLKGREADLFSMMKIHTGIVPWPLETILALLYLPSSGGYVDKELKGLFLQYFTTHKNISGKKFSLLKKLRYNANRDENSERWSWQKEVHQFVFCCEKQKKLGCAQDKPLVKINIVSAEIDCKQFICYCSFFSFFFFFACQ